MTEPHFYVLMPSAFGTFGIVWRETGQAARVCRIFLSDEQSSAQDLVRSAFRGLLRSSHSATADLGARIQGFLDGEAIAFDLGLMALDECSEFQRRVLLAEYGIPRGWVSTYGRIAQHLGVAGGARAVGRALARNPFPIVIPCHRAIGSHGELGGYQGGPKMKRALLELEGVRVSERGRVLVAKAYY